MIAFTSPIRLRVIREALDGEVADEWRHDVFLDKQEIVATYERAGNTVIVLRNGSQVEVTESPREVADAVDGVSQETRGQYAVHLKRNGKSLGIFESAVKAANYCVRAGIVLDDDVEMTEGYYGSITYWEAPIPADPLQEAIETKLGKW